MDSDTADTVQPTSSTGDNSVYDHKENNKCEVLPVPSVVDIHSTLSSVHRYLEAYSNAKISEHTDQLEHFVENQLLKNSVKKL
jgi:hypothetical protein